MKKITLVLVFAILPLFILNCGKENNNTSNNKEMKSDTSTVKRTDLNAGGENVSTVEFKCDGMTCAGCEKTITKSVKNLDGIKDIIADFKTKTVKIAFDSTKSDITTIEKSINDVKYKTERVK